MLKSSVKSELCKNIFLNSRISSDASSKYDAIFASVNKDFNILHKYADQLIRFWIDRGTIKKVKHGEYSYESKAEREARKTAEADAKVAAGAQQFRQQFAATQTPEAKAAERAKQNHGKLDFLNDLM